MGTGNILLGGNPAMDKHPIHGGIAILSVASCFVRNRVKLRPCGPPCMCFHLYDEQQRLRKDMVLQTFFLLKILSRISVYVSGNGGKDN